MRIKGLFVLFAFLFITVTGVKGENVTDGTGAGGSLSTGHSNVLLGVRTGYYLTTGYGNVFLGQFAGERSVTTIGSVKIGYYAGYGDITNYHLMIQSYPYTTYGLFGLFNSGYFGVNKVTPTVAWDVVGDGNYTGDLGVGGDFAVTGYVSETDSVVTVGNVTAGSVVTDEYYVASGGRFNDMFSYQLAGDVLNLDPAAHLILAWVSPITTEQDLSPHDHDMTYVGTMTTADQIPVGLVWALDMDGINDALYKPDHNDFSFDDAGGANGFTVNAWVQVVAAADSQMILSKYELTGGATVEEWAFFIDEDEYLSLMLCDDSVPAYESMQSDVALTTATWYMVTAVYDGAGGGNASAGITLYVNGASVAGTATDSGTYIGMENLSAQIRVGANKNGVATNSEFWTGNIGSIYQSVTQLTSDQVWEFYLRTRGYYNQ